MEVTRYTTSKITATRWRSRRKSQAHFCASKVTQSGNGCFSIRPMFSWSTVLWWAALFWWRFSPFKCWISRKIIFQSLKKPCLRPIIEFVSSFRPLIAFRNGRIFYWCTSVSTLLMLIFLILVWFKKFWDYSRPHDDLDASQTIPPLNRSLKALYGFSFDIMSNAVWRTIIYLLVVFILVNVSLLNLVRNWAAWMFIIEISAVSKNSISITSSSLHLQVECSVEISNNNDPFEHRSYSSCFHSWVRLVIENCLIIMNHLEASL